MILPEQPAGSKEARKNRSLKELLGCPSSCSLAPSHCSFLIRLLQQYYTFMIEQVTATRKGLKHRFASKQRLENRYVSIFLVRIRNWNPRFYRQWAEQRGIRFATGKWKSALENIYRWYFNHVERGAPGAVATIWGSEVEGGYGGEVGTL